MNASSNFGRTVATTQDGERRAPYTAGRPFRAKYPTRCAWSGEWIARGDTARKIIDAYIDGQEIGARIIAERFVNFACRLGWQNPNDIDFAQPDGAELTLVNRFAAVARYLRVRGTWMRGQTAVTPHNMERARKAAVSGRLVVW